MLNFPIFSKIAAVLVGLLAANSALVASAPPPPTQDPHIVDAAPLLSADQASALSKSLEQFEKQSGISLILVTDIEPAEEVKNILDNSIKATLVASCSMGNGQFAISANDELQKLVSPTELANLANAATSAASGYLDPGARLQATVDSLTIGLTKKLEVKNANANSAWTALAPLAWILGVSLTCLFVSGWAYAWVRSKRRTDRQLFFPAVHVEERFGAEFGGGVTGSTVSSRDIATGSTGDSRTESSKHEPDLVAN